MDSATPVATPSVGLADIMLPSFLLAREDGVFCLLEHLDGCANFVHAVDQLFLLGVVFRDIDYQVFLELCYRLEPGVLQDRIAALKAAGRPPEIRFAARMERMSPARIALYRSVKITGGQAFYLFEPVEIEVEVEVPRYEADENGVERVVGVELKTESRPTQLSFDEFVTQMWLKGVRFGLDAARVREVLAKGEMGMQCIARSLPPTDSTDASVRELYDRLRRNDAPHPLSNGRVDLTRFSNRFPQIKAGTRLLQKIPRRLGEPGREISGRMVAPKMPADFDLATLVGPGTRIEKTAEGEFLLAVQDGFLDLDADKGVFSISEKIVHRQGVSVRTTGDLHLLGDHYEEHGEIQEKRLVECKSITVHDHVFGRIQSEGGSVLLKKNLAGGTVLNRDGSVQIDGIASSAVIQSPNGAVRVARAQGCVIVGREVEIGEAIHCDILADQLKVGRMAGCVSAARQISIAEIFDKSGQDSLISMRLPPLAALDQQLRAFHTQRDKLTQALAQERERSRQLREEPALARYLTLMASVRQGKLQLSDEQKAALQKMAQQLAPQLRQLSALAEQDQKLKTELVDLDAKLASTLAEREALCAGIACQVQKVAAEVVVRLLHDDLTSPLSLTLGPTEVRSRLHASGGEPCFAGRSGQLDWQFVPPPAPVAN